MSKTFNVTQMFKNFEKYFFCEYEPCFFSASQVKQGSFKVWVDSHKNDKVGKLSTVGSKQLMALKGLPYTVF